jgi:DNA-binding response OmpR family regulator
MKILLLEDDVALNKSIRTLLKMYDFSVDSFTDGELAIEAIDSKYDIYILDINVSGANGIEVLDAIRMCNKEVPVIMISADVNIEVIMQSYASGCNDYLKKPFDIRELKIKLDTYSKVLQKEISFGEGLVFDMKHDALFYGKEQIKLTKKETALLKILLKDRGFNVPYDRIIDYVWEDVSEVNMDALRSIISRLRQKLRQDVIVGNVGLGYSIE